MGASIYLFVYKCVTNFLLIVILQSDFESKLVLLDSKIESCPQVSWGGYRLWATLPDASAVFLT